MEQIAIPGTAGKKIQWCGMTFTLAEDIWIESRLPIDGIACLQAQLARDGAPDTDWGYEGNWSVVDDDELCAMENDLSNPEWFHGICVTICTATEDDIIIYNAYGRVIS